MLRRITLAALAFATASLAAAPAVEESRTMQSAGDGRFTMALTGDSIITRRLSVYQEPEFLEMIGLLRRADVAFTNLEMLFHDYEPYPMHQSGGTYMRAAPALVDELTWAGFDMVARANNHTGDYGTLGMDLTTRYVDAAGLTQAGVGHSQLVTRAADNGCIDGERAVEFGDTFFIGGVHQDVRAGLHFGQSRECTGDAVGAGTAAADYFYG